MRKRPLLWTACVFLTGLAYERYQTMTLLLIPAVLLIQEVRIAARHNTWKKCAGRGIILLSAFLLGCGHMQKEESFREAYLSKLEDGNRVTIWGEIKSIETTEYGNRCILTDCYIRIHEEETTQEAVSEYTEHVGQMACNDIMVYTSSTHYQVGQIHEIIGQFQYFSTARNQGNFDSQMFYQSQKIDFVVEEESSRLLGVSQSWIKSSLLSLRDNLKQVFVVGMSEHAAGFYTGMILGDKSNLSETTKDLFAVGGISHILAISGLHVSIIGRRLYIWLRGRRMSFLAAGIMAGSVLLMYCYMVGSGMSTIRAVGMMLLYFLAQHWGRSYDMLNSLGGMCLLLLWENPFLLEYSGFWFSVLALVGIGFVGPVVADCIGGCSLAIVTQMKYRKSLEKVVQSLGMSLGITLSTLPIVACSYYEIPLYSTLVNMLALSLLAPVFLIAILGGVVGLWIPGIAFVLFRPCEWLLWFYEWLCSFVGALPGATLICGSPSPIAITMYYGVLLLGVWWLQSGKRCVIQHNDIEEKAKEIPHDLVQGRHLGMMKVLGLASVCWLLILYPKSTPFEITFLDVGQGDGIYISTGDGTTCFIDGGSTSVNAVGEHRMLPFLKSKGVSSIDYWFVTHADTDHISGLLEALSSGYPIKHLVLAEAAPKDDNYMMLLSLAEQSGTEILYMVAGDQICTPRAVLTCLYPGEDEQLMLPNIEQRKASLVDRNDVSLVLKLEVYNGGKEQVGITGRNNQVIFRALFTGDISTKVEAELIQQGLLSDVDLYKAAHHGSKYSNSLELLEVILPDLVVVSCSENNLYGHPSPEAIDRIETCGARMEYTMKSGQITIGDYPTR